MRQDRRRRQKSAPGFLFAGGGTGGHLFPALAIAEQLRALRPEARLLFTGTSDKIEARVVPNEGYSFTPIWISGFQRRWRLANLLVPIKIVVSLVQSFFLMRKFRPSVVIGTGGYIAGPVLLVASLLRIPTVIHESNSFPGVTTKMLARRVNRVITAFAVTKRWLSRTDNILLLGTPVRRSLGTVTRSEARARFGLDANRPTLLAIGGSLGAASINAALLRVADHLLSRRVQLIWQTGPAHFAAVRESLGSRPVGWVGPFIERMEDAYAAADLVLCRAGATTVAELTSLGKPSVLVPYPYAAEDHQTVNARTLADHGAAVVIPDAELPNRFLIEVLDLLDDNQRLATMGAAARALGRPEAGRRIAEEILQLSS
jgi:UDP-N-acetylglucosamine--N-acetylmuramyl-(pentapeptide) pyrophosphoryl-undecaprenol N-acetylglucosamine transferase